MTSTKPEKAKLQCTAVTVDVLVFPSVICFKTLHILRYKLYVSHVFVFYENMSQRFSLMAKNKKSRDISAGWSEQPHIFSPQNVSENHLHKIRKF